MKEQLGSKWQGVFGDVPPVGFCCRAAMPERWLRIHSLPESKRYPDSAEELTEILRRHNEVASALLGPNETCAVFVMCFSASPQPPVGVRLAELDLDLVGQTQLSVKDDEDSWMNFAASQVQWRTGGFDRTIKAVAEEAEAHVLFVNFNRQAVYAPYDGGADLFFAAAESVVEAKGRWSSWLSARSDGL